MASLSGVSPDRAVGAARDYRSMVAGVVNDVRAECKRRFGDEPCSTVFNAKGEPDAKECGDWCPLLGRRIEEEEE